MGRLMLLFLVVTPMVFITQAAKFRKISRNGKDYYERIAVDTKKGTEYSQLTEASSGKDAGDTMHDFNRKLTMTRAPNAKVCFLRESIVNAPRPAELLQLLRLVSRYASVKIIPQNQGTYKVVGKLTDRSVLSQEMADMCADLPIYRVAKGAPDHNDTAEDEGPAEIAGIGFRQRRSLGMCSASCSTCPCTVSCQCT